MPDVAQCSPLVLFMWRVMHAFAEKPEIAIVAEEPALVSGKTGWIWNWPDCRCLKVTTNGCSDFECVKLRDMFVATGSNVLKRCGETALGYLCSDPCITICWTSWYCTVLFCSCCFTWCKARHVRSSTGNLCLCKLNHVLPDFLYQPTYLGFNERRPHLLSSFQSDVSCQTMSFFRQHRHTCMAMDVRSNCWERVDAEAPGASWNKYLDSLLVQVSA